MCAKISYNKGSSHSRRLDVPAAYVRITKYCAYQERSHKEVREKLREFGLDTDDTDALLTRLITDGFVNEERFAKAFAGGKFRIKKWGRIRIEHALQSHDISKSCIDIGLKQIDEDDYVEALRKLIRSKAGSVSRDDPYQKWDVVSRYVIAKGYEPELVWKVIKSEKK